MGMWNGVYDVRYAKHERNEQNSLSGMRSDGITNIFRIERKQYINRVCVCVSVMLSPSILIRNDERRIGGVSNTKSSFIRFSTLQLPRLQMTNK